MDVSPLGGSAKKSMTLNLQNSTLLCRGVEKASSKLEIEELLTLDLEEM